jgi:hypothetical protein
VKLFQAFGRKREPAPEPPAPRPPAAEPPAPTLARWAKQKEFNRGSGLGETPAGYTWHYVEDAKTQQLVPRDLHNAVGHSGGVTALKHQLGSLGVGVATPVDAAHLLDRFSANAPAPESEIERFRIEAGFALPDDYLDFMRRADGGEGIIGEAYVILWRLGELLELNKAYEVDEYAPGLFLFGSDGGGEAFAFDLRSTTKPVIRAPFVGMDFSLVVAVAPTFVQFLRAVGRPEA